MAKLTKLYTTKDHLTLGVWDGAAESCMWCNNDFLVIGCGWNIATENYDLGISVFAINSNGSLTLKYQDTSLLKVTALCHDGRFLYVGIIDPNYSTFNEVKIYKLEVDGSLTLKDTILITDGYVTGIKSDGRFIYISTTYGTPWET